MAKPEKPERKIHKCCGEREKKVKYLRLRYVQREPPPRQRKTEKKDPKLLEKPIKPETSGGHLCCGKKICSGCEPRIVGRLYPQLN